MHFPIACWALGTVLDLMAWGGVGLHLPGIESAPLSRLLLWTGIVSAVPAAVAGVADYLTLPRKVQDGTTINRHMIWMGCAWSLYLGAGILREQAASFDSLPAWGATLAELAGFACLIFGGRAAAIIVFEELADPRSREP